jgi:UDP-N-acetylmuramyl pentapeptide synthase
MGEAAIYKLGVPGEHMAINSLAVLAAVKAAGADLARAALSLAGAEAAVGRGARHRLKVPGGELVLIDESYNAQPPSMKAAIALLGQFKPAGGGRRVAVLGDMLELGPFGEALHETIAAQLDEAGVDVLYAAGPLMAHLWAKIPERRRGLYASTSEQLRVPLVAGLRAGDVVMVKGSKGSRMGPLVEAVRAAYPPAKGDA